MGLTFSLLPFALLRLLSAASHIRGGRHAATVPSAVLRPDAAPPAGVRAAHEPSLCPSPPKRRRRALSPHRPRPRCARRRARHDRHPLFFLGNSRRLSCASRAQPRGDSLRANYRLAALAVHTRRERRTGLDDVRASSSNDAGHRTRATARARASSAVASRSRASPRRLHTRSSPPAR